MELMASGAGMMQQNNMQQKNYKNIFKNEREFYDIIGYEFKLENIEESFILKHKASKASA